MTARFGEFQLDEAGRQLLRGVEQVHLSPKAFDLLKLLLENRPRALSKTELHERLWPETFVVEANLANLIAEIRKALGDDARDPQFIRTVHGFGYAFCGAVTERPAQRAAAPGNCWLIWEHGHVALADGENLIGRDRDVTVWLDSTTVSRHHARISVRPEQVTIEDLGSKNGTYVRGERITSAIPLTDGDQIAVGSVVLTFRGLACTPSTETVVRSEPVAEREAPD
jgi:DNA-binding winged helix-turn-helix (wHTH) protein